MTKQERQASLAADRKLATAHRLLLQAQRILETAREDMITAGYGDEMKHGATEAILATISAARKTAAA